MAPTSHRQSSRPDALNRAARERHAAVELLDRIRRGSPFGPDGHLPSATITGLRSLDPPALGQAVTSLVRHAAGLSPVPAAVAADEIAELASGRVPAASLEVAALVGIFADLAADPSRQAITELIVRLLKPLDRATVLAPLGFDAHSLDVRARLAAALELAATSRARGEPPLPDRTTRAVHTRGTAGRPAAAVAYARSLRTDSLAGAGDGPSENAPAAATVAARRAYRAYGLLQSDDTVLVGRRFDLRVGLSEAPPPGVSGPPLEVPTPAAGPYKLAVQLFADGFDLDAGERWRLALTVSQQDLYPSVVVHLTPRDQPEARAVRTITATFSIDGETLGAATRTLVVTTRADDQDLKKPVAGATGTNITAPTGEPPADVTITITKGIEPGAILWGVGSSLPGVKWPADREIKTDVGQQPEKFTRTIIGDLRAREGTDRIFTALQGMAKLVRREIPAEVWAALKAAHDAVPGRPLDILILTAEPYVPWELAWMEEPFDPGAPPYLAAQANVGRWVLAGETVPKDPPRRIDAATMAVVWGVYDDPDLEQLKAAEQEAKDIKTTYDAASIDASSTLVTQLLSGHPPADVLHFAVHGRYDPQMDTEGLYLVEGLPIDVVDVMGSDLTARAPFVFLNACEVGEGHELLGDYTGIAPSLLQVGASAVVAPLWQVNDGIARQIALRFYAEALKSRTETGTSPGAGRGPAIADLMRRVRLGLVTDAAARSSTYLAYQFYGHPSLRLSWTQPMAAGGHDDA